MNKRSMLVNRRYTKNIIEKDTISYAQNYTEETEYGVFKVSKAVIAISNVSVPIVQTNTVFMSHDHNTAKQIFEFIQRDEPIDFRNATEVIVAFEFPDINVGERVIHYKINDKDRTRSSVEFILDRNVLDVGTTRVNQYVYILFNDGSSIDAGIVVFNLNRSFIDSNIDNIEEFYIRKLDDVREYLLYKANEIIARLLQLEGEFHDLDFGQLVTRRQLDEELLEITRKLREQRDEIDEELGKKVDKTYLHENMPTNLSIEKDVLVLQNDVKQFSHVNLLTEDYIQNIINEIFK